MKTRERRTRNGLPILKRVALEVDPVTLEKLLVINRDRYRWEQYGDFILLWKIGSEDCWNIGSETDRRNNIHWLCNCPYARIKNRICKHTLACMAMGWIPGDYAKLLRSVFVTE